MSRGGKPHGLMPEDVQPEELESYLEAMALEFLEGHGRIEGSGGVSPVGLMHHHGAARRFGSSPGGGPLTGRNTAAFARV